MLLKSTSYIHHRISLQIVYITTVTFFLKFSILISILVLIKSYYKGGRMGTKENEGVGVTTFGQ